MSTWKDEPRPAGERDPRRVGEILDRSTRRTGIAPAGVLGAIFSRWADLVGSEIAAHAEPKSIRDGVLTVAVDQPAWAVQLRYLASDLLDKIATFTGSGEVSEIQFRVAGAAPGSRPEKSRERPSRTRD